MARPSWYLPCSGEDWAKARMSTLVRDAFQCTECGQGNLSELEVHHLKPRINGGGHELGNLKTLCWGCHSKIHPHMRWQKAIGRRALVLIEREL